MAITKAKKKEIVEKAGDILKKGKSFVFVNFKGLKVNDTTLMRKDLRGKGVGYSVLKKTLLKRALSSGSVNGTMPQFDGEVALAYSEDLLAPAREVFSFEKKFKDIVKIVGGIFDGEYADREKMLSIATIPPQEVLYGQFVNLINSPIQRFVISLDQIAKKKS
jgi:large subunit ribosomal protein L10